MGNVIPIKRDENSLSVDITTDTKPRSSSTGCEICLQGVVSDVAIAKSNDPELEQEVEICAESICQYLGKREARTRLIQRLVRLKQARA
jgi:hypothetical protein